MVEIFKNIHKTLERSNKKNMISSSGSTPDADHEKIRSGQSYLYKTAGMESEVVEIRFHKKVYGSHLNKALRTAPERYPYLNTKLVELDGDFYIVQNKVSLVATRTETLIHYYCASRYKSDASAEGIRLADSPLLEGRPPSRTSEATTLTRASLRSGYRGMRTPCPKTSRRSATHTIATSWTSTRPPL